MPELHHANLELFPGELEPVWGEVFTRFEDIDRNSLRRLRYVNCGHLCGLVLRHGNSVERLESTGTVLGLFREWDCGLGNVSCLRGDLLALYTDGVMESCNEAGEEFGE